MLLLTNVNVLMPTLASLPSSRPSSRFRVTRHPSNRRARCDWYVHSSSYRRRMLSMLGTTPCRKFIFCNPLHQLPLLEVRRCCPNRSKPHKQGQRKSAGIHTRQRQTKHFVSPAPPPKLASPGVPILRQNSEDVLNSFSRTWSMYIECVG